MLNTYGALHVFVLDVGRGVPVLRDGTADQRGVVKESGVKGGLFAGLRKVCTFPSAHGSPVSPSRLRQCAG